MEGPRLRPKPSAVRTWHVSPEGFRDLRMAVFSARQSVLGTLAFPFVPFAIGTPVEAAFLGLLSPVAHPASLIGSLREADAGIRG